MNKRCNDRYSWVPFKKSVKRVGASKFRNKEAHGWVGQGEEERKCRVGGGSKRKGKEKKTRQEALTTGLFVVGGKRGNKEAGKEKEMGRRKDRIF